MRRLKTMARTKKTIFKFALVENHNILHSSLDVNGRRVFEIGQKQVPPVVVRHERAREHELLDHATYWARRSPKTWRNPMAWLDDYIASREEKVVDRVADIRKLLRTIEGLARNANIARSAKSLLRK